MLRRRSASTRHDYCPTARRKGPRLQRRSSAGGDHACLVGHHPDVTGNSQQRFDARFPLVTSRVRPCRPNQSTAPPCPPWLNPHSARCTRSAPPPAISCLGASRTPLVSARRSVRHPGVRETCTTREVAGRAEGARPRGSPRSLPDFCEPGIPQRMPDAQPAASAARKLERALSYRGATIALTVDEARSGCPQLNSGFGSYSRPS
jgi:hypothetical protein